MPDADEAATSIVSAAAVERPSTSFDNAVPQRLLDEALQVLLQQGHHALAQRVLLFLDQRHLHDAMRLLIDEHRGGGEADTAALREFHSRVDDSVHMMLDLDDDDPETFRDFRVLVLLAAREMAGFRDYGELPELHNYGNDGGGCFGAVVPAPAAVVAGVEKRTFHAGGNGGGGAECSICFEDFVDGVEVSVMPCPSRGHQFHTGCIAVWLGMSNVCPLCRHVLLVSSASWPPAASMMVAAEPETT